MKAVNRLRKRIQILEKEKMNLLAEFEELEKRAGAKVGELENEVTTLSKEVEALEDILNVRESSIKQK